MLSLGVVQLRRITLLIPHLNIPMIAEKATPVLVNKSFCLQLATIHSSLPYISVDIVIDSNSSCE